MLLKRTVDPQAPQDGTSRSIRLKAAEQNDPQILQVKLIDASLTVTEKLMKTSIVAFSLGMLLCGATPASACSIFAPCKPIPHTKVKAYKDTLSKKLEMRVAEDEKRLAAMEDREKGHVKTITLLHQQLVTLQIQMNALRQQNQQH